VFQSSLKPLIHIVHLKGNMGQASAIKHAWLAVLLYVLVGKDFKHRAVTIVARKLQVDAFQPHI
jgi:hypothetical protein